MCWFVSVAGFWFFMRQLVFSDAQDVHVGVVQGGHRAAGKTPPGGGGAGFWWTGWRRGGQSVAASSVIAVRAEDSSTMVLPVVWAASRAVMASRLRARGRPRAWPWMARTASSENRVSVRPARARWARRYPAASA